MDPLYELLKKWRNDEPMTAGENKKLREFVELQENEKDPEKLFKNHVVVFSSIPPKYPYKFLIHVLLSMGRFVTGNLARGKIENLGLHHFLLFFSQTRD